MSPMAQAVEPIRARTFLSMQEAIAAERERGIESEVVIVCNKCNKPTRDSEKRIVVCGEFRCEDCFAKLVRKRPKDFNVSEFPTDIEIKGLLREYHHHCVSNLYSLKKQPAFLLPNGPAPCG